MAGFFKNLFSSKKTSGTISVDENTLALMGLEISVFMNWYTEKYNKMLNQDQGEMIARIFLSDKHQNINFNESDVKSLSLIALTMDMKKTEEVRTDTGWDNKIDQFLKYHNIEINDDGEIRTLD